MAQNRDFLNTFDEQTKQQMKNISVIGAGTMGNGIAHTFALAGYQVKLIDISQERLNSGLKTIEKNLDRQVSKEKISQEQMQQTLNRISLTTEIRTGVTDSDLVIEAATEKLELKLEIFKTIDLSQITNGIYFLELLEKDNKVVESSLA